MGLTSEMVHWIGGGVLVVLSLLLLAHETGIVQSRWPRYLLPGVLIGWGVENLLDPLIHGSAAPGGYGAETLQHYVQGALMAAAGVVELLRARRRLPRRIWGLALPVALAAVGLLFAVHAQHDSAAPAILLTTQHRILGATFLVAAATKALGALERERTKAFSVAWLLPLLLCGIEMLLYTEGGASGGHGGH